MLVTTLGHTCSQWPSFPTSLLSLISMSPESIFDVTRSRFTLTLKQVVLNFPSYQSHLSFAAYSVNAEQGGTTSAS